VSSFGTTHVISLGICSHVPLKLSGPSDPTYLSNELPSIDFGEYTCQIFFVEVFDQSFLLRQPWNIRYDASKTLPTCPKFDTLVFVGHLFSMVVDQEQGNTIVNYYGPSFSKVLSPHGYNTHQMKVEKDIPSSFNMWIEMRKDKDSDCISLIHLYLHSTKHVWILTISILHWYLWLPQRWRHERVITSQREQYGVTVHLFIGMGRSPGKITFMTFNIYLQTTWNIKVYLVFSSSDGSFGTWQYFFYARSSSWEPSVKENMTSVSLCQRCFCLEDLRRKRRPPTVFILTSFSPLLSHL
jgi:hypothetical protein